MKPLSLALTFPLMAGLVAIMINYKALAKEQTPNSLQQARDAVELLQESFKCPVKNPGWQTDAGVFSRHPVHQYQGDTRTFRVKTKTTSISTIPGGKTTRSASIETISASFADLEKISLSYEGIETGWAVILSCRRAKECISKYHVNIEPTSYESPASSLLVLTYTTMGAPPPTYNEQLPEADFIVCDQEAAENIKIAMEILIKFNK
jgi:hypothetical protein